MMIPVSNTIEFIAKANIIHNNKYIYDKVDYIKAKIDVIIICKKHGEFKKRPDHHLNGVGCNLCSDESRTKTKEQLLKQMNDVHNNIYKYDLKNYKTCKSIIRIKCKKHSWFKQKVSNHLNMKQGCPKCKHSKGEQTVERYLIEHKINYINQYSFKDCKYKQVLKFDFFLPNYNICIEYDGEQHYNINEYLGGEKRFIEEQIRDNIKTNYCMYNTIDLIRIRYDENIYNILDLRLLKYNI